MNYFKPLYQGEVFSEKCDVLKDTRELQSYQESVLQLKMALKMAKLLRSNESNAGDAAGGEESFVSFRNDDWFDSLERRIANSPGRESQGASPKTVQAESTPKKDQHDATFEPDVEYDPIFEVNTLGQTPDKSMSPSRKSPTQDPTQLSARLERIKKAVNSLTLDAKSMRESMQEARTSRNRSARSRTLSPHRPGDQMHYLQVPSRSTAGVGGNQTSTLQGEQRGNSPRNRSARSRTLSPHRPSDQTRINTDTRRKAPDQNRDVRLQVNVHTSPSINREAEETEMLFKRYEKYWAAKMLQEN